MGSSNESNLTDPNSNSLNGKRKERSGTEESIGCWENRKQKVLEEEQLEEEQQPVESQEKGKQIGLDEEQESGGDRKQGKLIILDEEEQAVGSQKKGKQMILEEEEEPAENREKGKQILLELEETEEELEVNPKYWKLFTNDENRESGDENHLPVSFTQNNSLKVFQFPPTSKEDETEKKQPTRIFKCDFCPKIFTNPSAFGGHQNAHRKERAELNRNSDEKPGTDFLRRYERLGIPPLFSSLAGRNSLGLPRQSNQPATVPYRPRPLDVLSFGLGDKALRRVSAGSALLNPMGFSRTGAGNTSCIHASGNDLFSNPQRPGFNGGTMSGLVQNSNGATQSEGSLGLNVVPMSPGLPENRSNSFLNPHRLGFNGGSFPGTMAEAAGYVASRFPWSSSMGAGLGLGPGPRPNSGILENRNNTIQNEQRVSLFGVVLSDAAQNNRNREFWGPPPEREMNLNGGGLGNVVGRNVNGSGEEGQRNGGSGTASGPGPRLGFADFARPGPGFGLGFAAFARNGEEARPRPDGDHADIDLTLKLSIDY